MKKVAAILLLVVIISGCHHSTPTPPNAHTTQPPNSTSTTTTCATANENALVGKWNIKKMVTWMYVDSVGAPNNTYYIVPYYATRHDSTMYNNPSMDYMQLYSNLITDSSGTYNVTGYSTNYLGTFGALLPGRTWIANQDTLKFQIARYQSVYHWWHIDYITTDSLILSDKTWEGIDPNTSTYTVWYLHK